jgi:hypothetical protein
MSGVEGAEREDYDDGEVGVGPLQKHQHEKHQPLRTRRFTKENRGLAGLTGSVVSVE